MKSNNYWSDAVDQAYLGDKFWFNLKTGIGWESETTIGSKQEWVKKYYEK